MFYNNKAAFHGSFPYFYYYYYYYCYYYYYYREEGGGDNDDDYDGRRIRQQLREVLGA
jgi:hypothetical protein